jgi:hypothetical protein
MSNGGGPVPVDDNQPQASPTPAATPAPAPNDPMNQMMGRLMQQTTQPHSQLPAPHPQQPNRIHSAAGFLPMLFMNIQNAYAAHKEKQVRAATAMYSGLQAAHERAEQMAQGDPQKTMQLFQADPVVQETFHGKQGEKNIKAMKELLQVDFMNPEANQTAHHEGLKRVIAASGIQKVMKMLGAAVSAHKASQAQAQPQGGTDPNQAAQRLEQRAVPEPMDVKGGTEIAKAQSELTKSQADLTRAQMEYRDRWDTKLQADGTWIAYDKSDPAKTIPLKVEGKAVTGTGKVAAGEGKVAMVGNVPFGITHAGPDGKPQVVKPGDPEWTPRDQSTLDAANAASARSEANKAKLAQMRETFFSSLPQAVLYKVDDPQKGVKAGELAFVPRKEAAANPSKYAPVGAGDKALGTQARFGEIQATVDGTNQAIRNLPDTGFDAKARAQLSYIMRAPNPQSAMDSFLKSESATALTPEQTEYVQWLASLSESVQALVSLQGMGARSSDKMRGAIAAMVPGAATPSRAFATGQMKKLQIELDALWKGVPGLGALDSGAVAPKGTISFKEGDTTYDIPKEKVAAFKKAHPNATTATN